MIGVVRFSELMEHWEAISLPAPGSIYEPKQRSNNCLKHNPCNIKDWITIEFSQQGSYKRKYENFRHKDLVLLLFIISARYFIHRVLSSLVLILFSSSFIMLSGNCLLIHSYERKFHSELKTSLTILFLNSLLYKIGFICTLSIIFMNNETVNRNLSFA